MLINPIELKRKIKRICFYCEDMEDIPLEKERPVVLPVSRTQNTSHKKRIESAIFQTHKLNELKMKDHTKIIQDI